VAVHIWGRVGDAAMEESEWGREGLADVFRISVEGLDLVSSRVGDGDELGHAFHDGLVRAPRTVVKWLQSSSRWDGRGIHGTDD
jgi:hypothetical protein